MYKRRPHYTYLSRTTVCKACRLADTRLLRKQYRQDWIKFLSKKYGCKPTCEICNKKLAYLSGDLSLSVCFDHRTGNEILKVGPSM